MSIGTLPLATFTVLDLTHARAGPTAVRQLADWGANVIKIEPPQVNESAIVGFAAHACSYGPPPGWIQAVGRSC